MSSSHGFTHHSSWNDSNKCSESFSDDTCDCGENESVRTDVPENVESDVGTDEIMSCCMNVTGQSMGNVGSAEPSTSDYISVGEGNWL